MKCKDCSLSTVLLNLKGTQTKLNFWKSLCLNLLYNLNIIINGANRHLPNILMRIPLSLKTSQKYKQKVKERENLVASNLDQLMI